MFNQKEEQALRHSLSDLAHETNRLASTIDSIEKTGQWSVFTRPRKFLFFSFLNGLMIALGSTIGFALVLYILQLLGYLPIIGQFFSFLSSRAGR